MDIQHALQTYNDDLNSLYQAHLSQSIALQRTLLDQVLPNVLEDSDIVPDENAVERAREWLEDRASIFRMFKRHKFTSTFAQEALRSTLIWRLISPLKRPSGWTSPRLLYLLPTPSQDFLGRPIVVLRLAALNQCQDDIKPYMLYTLEYLRIHLLTLNSAKQIADAPPILQYILLVDMADVSLRTINVDLLTWYMRDAVSRFPGLLAAVFMLNYSWTHSGVWNLLKRILPDSALSKVFFPPEGDLHRVVSPSCLPEDLGGILPALDTLPDALNDLDRIADVVDNQQITDGDARHRDREDRSPTGSLRPPSHPPALPHADAHRHPTPTDQYWSQPPISSRSRQNPFFGYPIVPTFSASNQAPTPTTRCKSAAHIPQLHHGRQRKRDLLRTLALLWWERWRTPATLSVALALLALLFFKLLRRSSFHLSASPSWWSWIWTWAWRWAHRRGRETL